MVGERQFIALASMSASVYLPEPGGAGQNHRLGKVVARQHLAQAMDDVGIAVEIGEHSSQLSAFSKARRLALQPISAFWHVLKDLSSLAESDWTKWSNCRSAEMT